MDKDYFLNNIDYWTYAKRSHWQYFDGYGPGLYGEEVHMDSARLKCYQDFLIVMMVKNFFPEGSRLLEVGGGHSPVLNYFTQTYECWNIGNSEELGEGPKGMREFPYRVIKDYMGDFNKELPDDYFDFVFSVSALDHVADQNQYKPICDDIDRVLKAGGLSAHLLDVVFFNGGGFWTNNIIHTMFEKPMTLNDFVELEEIAKKEDLYVMGKEAYDKYWAQITGKSYEQHGNPTSSNLFWTK